MNDTAHSPAETVDFTHPVTVRWSDCDPAKIVYTGRIPCFALEAIDAWWDRHTGYDWYRINIDRHVGTPFVHLSMDFRSPITPRHPLMCEVRLLRLGETSVRFGVRGSQDGVLRFEGKFVQVFVDPECFGKISAPDDIRPKLEALVAR